ncbi:uncharacterized protein PV07_00943 [Cladophialophora immunda]|uniref:Uncharacterized protein n=1 Tax=Cladophialophora immunda TaxID=569365 RepID=A0A0D2B954_9EURO|nr:uncharacterized protein PV07_00943 [Cladophialophora immunda]KIW34147.1 hypothetical protein PV07_00943 [Cladophialophora immunda]
MVREKGDTKMTANIGRTSHGPVHRSNEPSWKISSGRQTGSRGSALSCAGSWSGMHWAARPSKEASAICTSHTILGEPPLHSPQPRMSFLKGGGLTIPLLPPADHHFILTCFLEQRRYPCGS